jgi:hypothetical protein
MDKRFMVRDPRKEPMMHDAKIAFIAGFLTGRGGFGLNASGVPWLYFRSLDSEIASAALERWGGAITENATGDPTSYKYTAFGPTAIRVLEALEPHLCGYKRHRAEELLDDSY